jgi:hypothetical protein
VRGGHPRLARPETHDVTGRLWCGFAEVTTSSSVFLHGAAGSRDRRRLGQATEDLLHRCHALLVIRDPGKKGRDLRTMSVGRAVLAGPWIAFQQFKSLFI